MQLADGRRFDVPAERSAIEVLAAAEREHKVMLCCARMQLAGEVLVLRR